MKTLHLSIIISILVVVIMNINFAFADSQPLNATQCSIQNLDYYKKVYNSTMDNINGYFVTYLLHEQNHSLGNVSDELFGMAKDGAYDKANEASYCLGINDVNRSSLAQPLPDAIKILNYNTTAMRQYLPVFVDHTYYLQQYKEADSQLEQLITQTSDLEKQMSEIKTGNSSDTEAKIHQLQQQMDENNNKRQSLVNELDLLQNESRAMFLIDPVTKKKLDDAEAALVAMYMYGEPPKNANNKPVEEISANYEYKNLEIMFDPDKTTHNPTGDKSQEIIIDIKKVAGNIPLKISYGKIMPVGSELLPITPIASPLQQFKSGGNALDVKCSTNYVLVIKAEDGSPACVKRNDTVNLMNQGWAINQFIVSIDYRYQGISVIERDPGVQRYENGTYLQTMTIYVFINNFTQSSYPLKVQVLHDDIPYRTDTISSTDILSDGFYKYQFTQYPAMFGNKIIVTYGNKTSQTVFANPIPP